MVVLALPLLNANAASTKVFVPIVALLTTRLTPATP
jgi:hypothetical protein